MTTQQLGMALSLLTLCEMSALAAADEPKDEIRSDSNAAKRSVKKAGNRIAEAACTGTKAECEAKKAKHRVGEAKDKLRDKTNETVDEVKEAQ